MENKQYDLSDAFRWAGNKAKNSIIWMLAAIRNFFLFSWQHKTLLLIFLFSGLITGFVVFKSTKRYYRSEGVLELYGCKSQDVVPFLNKTIYINDTVLAEQMNVPLSTIENIKKLKAYYFIDLNRDKLADFIYYKEKNKDTTLKRLENRIALQLDVYNVKDIPNIQQGILNYIKKNNYISRLNQNRLIELNKLINQSKEEIKNLDSLERNDYFQYRKEMALNKSQFVIINEQKSDLYHNDILKLIETSNRFIREFEYFKESAFFVEDFYIPAKVKNPLIKYLTYSGIVFLLAGYFILLLISVNETTNP